MDPLYIQHPQPGHITDIFFLCQECAFSSVCGYPACFPLRGLEVTCATGIPELQKDNIVTSLCIASHWNHTMGASHSFPYKTL